MCQGFWRSIFGQQTIGKGGKNEEEHRKEASSLGHKKVDRDQKGKEPKKHANEPGHYLRATDKCLRGLNKGRTHSHFCIYILHY